ncbi:MAG TPA: efflux RND transporter periplasmic adaptor subunit [Candidatus Limnocylindria bacterium]|nr:efflux RND transporter periplasmic adaptor subunit [Candidatus Limnocylindria bacterium]
MNNPASTTNPAAAAPQAPKKQPRLARNIVICLVIALTIAAISIAIPWANYRMNNVVLREAAVRGSVTKLGTRIEGRVKSVEVEAGERVTKGQVLLRMEDSHLQAAMQRARGELASATRELESEKLGIEQNRRRLTLEIERSKGALRKAKGELEAQQSSLTKLEKQYERTASLVKTGAAATAELDKVTGDRDKALAMVNAANGVVESAESTYDRAINELDGLQVRENHVGVLDAKITIARAQVAAAEADLDAATLKAPEDGRVIERIVNIGGSAKVGEPIISLWIGKAWVEAWADERDLHKIHAGSPVDISFDATPSRRLAGHVESIGLLTDKQLQPGVIVPSTLHAFVRQNAMVPIRIALEDENPPVQLGLSVLVGIRKGSENSNSNTAAGVPRGGSAWSSPAKPTATNAAISQL